VDCSSYENTNGILRERNCCYKRLIISNFYFLVSEVFVAILKDGLLEDVGSKTAVGRPRLVTSWRVNEAVQVFSLLVCNPSRVAQFLCGCFYFLVQLLKLK